jgi:ATP-dependent Clp protease ATP-binding subunit ClpC
LALFLFGSEKNLIRFDMSEFKEEHSVSKLIGSPPGYVGHDEEGQLTGQIRTEPHGLRR